MDTLYDLLGALADDDAESLRAAFRKAVKAHHPDITGDRDDPVRFRRIVHAHEILSDPDQRAAYDRLLDLARQQRGWKSTLAVGSDRLRKLASDAIMVVVIATVLVGGYALFERVSQASIVPMRATELATPGAIEMAVLAPAPQFDDSGAAARGDRLDVAADANDTVAPSAVESAANAAGEQAMASVGPDGDRGVKDAKSYWQRGTIAYRNGDLDLAAADFDRAIQLDPGFADAYVDRAIALYRMHQFDRAFADLTQAKRLESANRSKASHLASRSLGRN